MLKTTTGAADGIVELEQRLRAECVVARNEAAVHLQRAEVAEAALPAALAEQAERYEAQLVALRVELEDTRLRALRAREQADLLQLQRVRAATQDDAKRERCAARRRGRQRGAPPAPALRRPPAGR